VSLISVSVYETLEKPVNEPLAHERLIPLSCGP
jgi:hypothetical protein